MPVEQPHWAREISRNAFNKIPYLTIIEDDRHLKTKYNRLSREIPLELRKNLLSETKNHE